MTCYRSFAIALLLPLTALAQQSSYVLGYTEPFRSIDLSAAESGLVGVIHVAEGEAVTEGQALLQLDISAQEAQLRIAEAEAASVGLVEAAEAEVDVAQDRYNKIYRLRKSGTAASSEMTRASADLKSAKGRHSAAVENQKIAQLRVDQIRTEIERRTVRSPIDGIVLEINRDVAEAVSQGRSFSDGAKSDALIRVVQLDQLRLTVHLPTWAARQVQVGDNLPVRILEGNSLIRRRSHPVAGSEAGEQRRLAFTPVSKH